jgi:15-cis-phytoene synthase
MSSGARASSAGAQAYRSCEQITRRSAANFYYGIRLLPLHKRHAMCAVYAFARRIDDIGDGPLEPVRKLALLDDAKRAVHRLSTANGLAQADREDPVGDGEGSSGHLHVQGGPAHGPGADPVLLALADARLRFALPLDALGDLIEGVRMDVEGVAYERFEDLVPYCRRVAGSIGRLCVAIFEARQIEQAWGLADDLGVAMQLTNILRDVREDADNGRVYLPREDLIRYQLSTDGRFEGEEGQFDAFMRFQAARAREWFVRGMELIPLLDRRSAACVLAMSGIYRRLLDRIEDHPELTARERISLPIWEKGWVATRSLLGAAR